MRVAFMGNPSFAISSLESILQSRHKLVAVISNPPKPIGRKKIMKHTEVGNYAIKNNLELIELGSFDDDDIYKKIVSLKIDIFVVVAFRILPEKYILIPRFGSINLHASFLPKYRGAAPIQHALINGEDYTGYTFFRINEKLDEGNIILQERYQILESDNCSSIQDSLTELAVNNLSVAINRLIQGEFLDSDQPDEISYANKIQKEDSIFYWDLDVVTIFNRIRALSTWPVARTNLLGEDIKIIDANYIQHDHDMTFGEIKAFSKDELLVSAKGGYISINKLQLEGRKIITNRDLFNSNSEFKVRLLNNLGLN